jgi:large subunit ribosomal protein L25
VIDVVGERTMHRARRPAVHVLSPGPTASRSDGDPTTPTTIDDVLPEEHDSMSDQELIKAETRTEFGKGAARRIRRADKVPAVLYGHGTDPKHISLPGHETMMALKHGGANALLRIDLDGTTHLALTKQIQADPIKGFLEHLDFVEVRKGEKVTVDVPVHVVGEVQSDAMAVTDLNVVSVEAEATNIPEYLEVSVEDAEVGVQIFAKDIDLPQGSTLLTDDEALVVNVVHAPTAEEIESELEEAEAEAGIEHDEPEVETEAAPEGEAAEGEAAEAAESGDES